jgi:hypothetical protein
MVAVCSPRQPNQGVMLDDRVRQNLSPPPKPGRWVNFRMADYLLRQHNISIPQTPSEMSRCPAWMRMGFALYRRLEELGFQAYPKDGPERQLLEVYPYASYAVMLEMLPLRKHGLEGCLQRQLILYESGLKLPDPMRFFEEITRYRLLKGILPMEELYTAGQLDALAGAFTAWVAASNPDEVTLLGDPTEGQVVLPTRTLKDRY